MLMTVGKVYNFRTVAPVTLGATFRSMKFVQSNLGNFLTSKEKILIQNKAVRVSNELGQFNVNIEQEEVFRFTDINGNEELFLKSWIIESTIEFIDRVNMTINLTDLTTDSARNAIRLLIDNGYKINSKTIVEI